MSQITKISSSLSFFHLSEFLLFFVAMLFILLEMQVTLKPTLRSGRYSKIFCL